MQALYISEILCEDTTLNLRYFKNLTFLVMLILAERLHHSAILQKIVFSVFLGAHGEKSQILNYLKPLKKSFSKCSQPPQKCFNW